MACFLGANVMSYIIFEVQEDKGAVISVSWHLLLVDVYSTLKDKSWAQIIQPNVNITLRN